MTVKYTANSHRKHSRFAVVVSKKVHKGAAGRNRIRRRLYEIIRHQVPYIKSPHDVVMIVFSSETMTMPNDELVEAIKQLFEQANLYKK